MRLLISFTGNQTDSKRHDILFSKIMILCAFKVYKISIEASQVSL